MSGSFWKFGQDFSSETPISKTLNRAFIKIDFEDDHDIISSEKNSDDEYDERPILLSSEIVEFSIGVCEEDVVDKETEDSKSDTADDHGDEKEEEEDIGEDSEIVNKNILPTTEAEFMDYKPNLDVLDDLLDDEELYTELMCSNFKLLIFLKYPEVLSKLIDYVTSEEILDEKVDELDLLAGADIESDDEDEESIKEEQTKDNKENKNYLSVNINGDDDDARSQISQETSVTLPHEMEEQVELRRARMAAEILSADVWPIASSIMENKDLLEKLWCVMDHPAPLSIIASTYFMKISERLLDMDITGMLQFILTQKSLVDRFLTHIDNPPLMDFLLKVISTDKPDTPTAIIEKLKEQNFISKLLDNLNPEHSSSIQSAAGDFLKAFVTISANSNNEIASGIGPNELTRELVSPDIMEKLIKIMLKGGTSLNNGVGIIIELIRKNNSDYDFVQVMYTTLETHPPNDRDPIYLGYLVRLFAKYMPEFNKMLSETSLLQLQTPFGSIEPLGFERFKICELVAELLHCSNMTLLNEPTGEQIVKERDIERERVLKLEQQSNSDVYFDEDIEGKLNSLKLNPDSASLNEPNNVDELDTQSENSAVEVTEKLLRENPVVGDHLKIVLHDTQIITTILEMFFHFAWNNFLHNVVFDIVQQIFNGPLKTGYNRYLLADLLAGTQITKMIMEGDKKCSDYEKETGLRLGYMGHLTLIAEEVAKFAAYMEEMKMEFDDETSWNILNDPTWKDYTDTILAETREKYNTVLGDFREDEECVNEDEEDNQALDAEDMINDQDIEDDIVDDMDRHAINNPISFDNQINVMDIYNGFNNQNTDDVDDGYYAEYNDTDNNRYYEYIDANGNKTRLNLNPTMDYDLKKDEEKDSKIFANEDKKSNSKFSNYMSHELGRDFGESAAFEDDIGNNLLDSGEGEYDENSTEEIDSKWDNSRPSAFSLDNDLSTGIIKHEEENVFRHQFQLAGDNEEGSDDDYMDPNDDGQSYAKPNHPLYSTVITPTASHKDSINRNDSEDSQSGSEENSDNSDSSDAELEERPDEIILNDDENISGDIEDERGGYSLFRSRSKDNLAWDDDEQDRLIDMVNYNRQHGNS